MSMNEFLIQGCSLSLIRKGKESYEEKKILFNTHSHILAFIVERWISPSLIIRLPRHGNVAPESWIHELSYC